MDDNIVFVKLFPGITPVILKSILEIPNLKAVVIETYGQGMPLPKTGF